MFARLSQLTRHLTRPLPNYAHQSAFTTSRIMATHPNSRKMIHTAGCIIIGDEVLGGKTTDTNSSYMAKFCFSLGIALKRIEVIADDEAEIVEACKRMSSAYDFVVTSGGIGPTHDDITYQSIAAAYKLTLTLHEEAFARMKRLSRPHPSQPNFDYETPSQALTAKKRMIELPYDKDIKDDEQVVFTADDLWVPVAVVNGNIHILPGVPRLFERMLTGLKPRLLPKLTDPEGKGVYRILFSTPMAESSVAGYLTELAGKVEEKGIKVGSYPRWGKSRNTVTLVGRDKEFMDSLVPEVEKNVNGRRVEREDEDDDNAADPDS